MRKVGIDDQGYYYYYDTGNNLSVEFDGAGNAYDADTGASVQLVYESSDGSVIQDITDDVARVIIAIYGNPANAPRDQAPVRSTSTGIRQTVYAPNSQQQNDGGLFSGGSIKISSQTAILIGIGVLIFAFGKSKGR